MTPQVSSCSRRQIRAKESQKLLIENLSSQKAKVRLFPLARCTYECEEQNQTKGCGSLLSMVMKMNNKWSLIGDSRLQEGCND